MLNILKMRLNLIISFIIFIIILNLLGCSNKKQENHEIGKITSEEMLDNIYKNLEKGNGGINIKINEIKAEKSGINLTYSIEAKENVYVVDYNKLNEMNCENEIRQRLIVDNTLYVILHAGISLFCDPYTAYSTSPPWYLLLMKKNDVIEEKVFIKKDPFWDEDYAKKIKDVKKLKLIFGYIPLNNLEDSYEYIEKVDDKYIKTRKTEERISKYKILDTDIEWNENNPYQSTPYIMQYLETGK